MTIKHTDPVLYMSGQLSRTPRPAAITDEGGGGKFTPQGVCLPFPGNTFLCHIDPTSRAHRALRALQQEIRSGPYGHYFTFLPPASLHMTVFQGVAPGCTSVAEGWPAAVPPGTDRDVVTDIFVNSLSGHSFPQGMKVDATDLFALHSISVAGATETDETVLRQIRDQLSRITSIRYHAHDTYIFHITLAYPLTFTDPGTARSISEESDRLFARYRDELITIDIPAVEFCSFENMHQFDRILRL
ncbi:DUF1868 domain-containing protein [Cohaesibacter haloalkalitolerans]|uniref:DUF1868 domain-containing protein n=1 Tax=Cohaesibacter haloalkalitolerans TaxID=1162980 RepID=UPI000E646A4C|nr:DUF1868 domain-containing protein [Cohaesibacter haloalkalitolerans]